MKSEDRHQVMEGFLDPCKALGFSSEGQEHERGAERWCGLS